jgi:p-cumate 2,3-dioxygenase alpha subunit
MDLSQMVIDDHSKGIFRINRAAMTSSKVLGFEQERIFERCWLYVGHESEIENPGDYVRRAIAGRPLIFMRGEDGQARIFYNTCPHRGARICRQDSGNAKTFQCFYHSWTFNNQGQLIGMPDKEGYCDSFQQEDFSLKSPPQVDKYRGFYFVNFDKHAEDLATYLAGAKEFIDLIVDQSEIGMRIIPGTHKYSMRANWKLMCENSVDGYHALPLHSTYFDYVAGKGQDRSKQVVGASTRAYSLGNGHSIVESPAPYGRPVALWHPMYGEEAKPEIEKIRARLVERFGENRAARIAGTRRLLLIFPNLVLHDIMAVTIRQIWPVSHDFAEITSWALAPKEESATMQKYRLDSFLEFLGPAGFASPDDIEAVEACQEGFAAKEVEWSDNSRGMKREPRAHDEVQIRAFWREWNSLLKRGNHAEWLESAYSPTVDTAGNEARREKA